MNDELNDIDYLMSLDPMELSTAEGTPGRRKLDAIIAYHRNQRAVKESGGKRPKKDKGPEVKIDLQALGLKPATPKMNRRI
jgi:hypothetical protein